jgi:integrase
MYFYWKGVGDMYLYSHDGISFTSQRHAERVLERIRSEVDSGTFDPRDYLPKKLEPLKFENFAKRWLTHQEKRLERGELVPSYYNRLKGYVEDRFMPFFKTKDIRHITTGDIVSFHDNLSSQELPEAKTKRVRRKHGVLSLKSQKNILGVLNKMFADALDWGDIEKRPKFPSFVVPEPDWNWISRETQDLILSAVPVTDRPIFLFLTREGVRTGEACALQWHDIDFDNDRITIRRAFSDGELRSTKTKKQRPIPLDPEVKKVIKSLPAPIKKDQFVFTRNQRPYSNSILYKTWKKACAKVGVDEIHVYAGTRHSMASQAANRGVPVQKIGAVLGHSDLKSTLRYAHLDVNSLREVVISPEQEPAEIIPFQKQK